jgi:50S ribosomal protein L16 3-hydroxylase
VKTQRWLPVYPVWQPHVIVHTIPVIALPELRDVAALLSRWSRNVNVPLAGASDEHRSISATPTDARTLYAHGMNLVFNRVEEQVPALRPWLAGITRELGISTLVGARCIVYASPNDRGASTHFDQNANFVVQLRGTKTWRLAPNEFVQNPVDRYALNMAAVSDEVAQHATGRLPRRMPRDAEEVVLRPGSVLFVPRGIWHETRAGGESLSLNFTFSQPTWADLLVDALRRRLHGDPRWRELADGVAGASRARRAAAVRRLDTLLQAFRDDAAQLAADEVIRDVLAHSAIGEASAFRRRRGVPMRVRGSTLVVGNGASRVEIAIDPEAAGFSRWIAGTSGSQTLAQLRRRAGRVIDPSAMPRVVETLVAAGALERH